MTALDYSVRLFILSVFLLTGIVSLTRALHSEDRRVVTGNLLISAAMAVGTYTQIVMRSTPVDSTDWARLGLGCLCIAYVITIARKGL